MALIKKNIILAIFRHCVSDFSISPGCVAGTVLQTALFLGKKKVMGRLFSQFINKHQLF